jgi:hypothetical protein
LISRKVEEGFMMKDHEARERWELRFVCPECASDEGLCTRFDTAIEIDHVYEDGSHEWCCSSEGKTTFSCGMCESPLRDEKGHKIFEDRLAEWLKTHCDQDDSEDGEEDEDIYEDSSPDET